MTALKKLNQNKFKTMKSVILFFISLQIAFIIIGVWLNTSLLITFAPIELIIVIVVYLFVIIQMDHYNRIKSAQKEIDKVINSNQK